MIVPSIHRWLNRSDLARLVSEIVRTDPTWARPASFALESGRVDSLLDSPVALDVVRGRGGAPAALPLTLLWYVPVRAALRERGENDIQLADYTATLPVAFVSSRSVRRVGLDEPALTRLIRAVEAVPRRTIAQGERAANCAALALWWAGCFPERITRHGGPGMVRAFTDFASTALQRAAQVFSVRAPDAAELFDRAAHQAPLLRETLAHVRVDYLGRAAHTQQGRLARYLSRLRPFTSDDPPVDV